MKLSQKDWNNYIDRMSAISKKAAQEMYNFMVKHGVEDVQAIIDYAYGLVTKYGEGSAELACQMYDAIAELQKMNLPSAIPAETMTYDETAKAVQGCLKQSKSGQLLPGTVFRMVKQAGADTTMQNAARDRGQFAWVPSGDTCVFCLVLASRGWQNISKKGAKKHAEHIHANCDCNYVVRFKTDMTVEGYNPQDYLDKYNSYDGKPKDKINAMRREQYAKNKDEINEKKRIAYNTRKEDV